MGRFAAVSLRIGIAFLSLAAVFLPSAADPGDRDGDCACWESCKCTITAAVPQTAQAGKSFQVNVTAWLDSVCGAGGHYAWRGNTGEWPQNYDTNPFWVQYNTPGTYTWTVWVIAGYGSGVPFYGCSVSGSITIVPETCTISACTATVPAQSNSLCVDVSGSATLSQCDTTTWDFSMDWGDNSTPTGSDSNRHAWHCYATPGSYPWKMTFYAYEGGTLPKCEQTGTISVAAKQCLDVGQVRICATTKVDPTPTNPKYLFEGNVTVNEMLYLPGVVSFQGNPQDGYGTLSAPGGVQVKTNNGTEFLLPADTRNAFEVEGSTGSLQPNFGTSPGQLGIDFMGVPMILAASSIKLTPQGPYCEPTCLIGVEGAATLAKVKVKMLFPPGTGVLFQGTEVLFGQLTPNITLAQANFTYDAFQDKLEGSIKLALPAVLGGINLEGNIKVLSGCIDGGGITLPLPEIPLGTTGLATKDGTFEFSGRCVPPTSLFFGGNLKFLKIPENLFTIDHVGLRWVEPTDWFEVDGGTAMFLGYPQANVKGRMSASNPRLWLVGKMNVAELLKGDVDIQLVLDSLRGFGKGDLALRIEDFTCSDTSRICRAIRAVIRSSVTLPYTAANAKMDVKVRWDITKIPPIAFMDFQGMILVGPVSLAGAVEVDIYGPHVRIGSNYDDMWSVWGVREIASAPLLAVEKSLSVPAGQERVVFSVVSDGAAPSISLRNPQGQTITPSNVGGFPGVTYYAETGDTVALFRVETPAAGAWTLAVDNLPADQAHFVALAAVPPPATTFTGVTQNGDSISMSASVTPASPDTKVGFYYSEAADGSVSGVIAEDLPATSGTVSATWDASKAGSGTYYLLARTEDGKNPPVTAIYTGSIQITHAGPQPPTAVSGIRSGDSVTLMWTPSSTPGVAGYTVRYTDAPEAPGYPFFTPTGSGAGATITGLDPAKGYRFCVQAFDAQGNQSVESDAVTFPKPGSTPGDCDGDGQVSIGEVQKAINMFLGSVAAGCSVDSSGDGTVSIGEVQKVINAFLGIASGVSVTVSPSTATVSPGGTQPFAATVTGSADTAVSWSVQEGAAGGDISPSGLYTAPAASGLYHVAAASHADPTKSGTAAVTVSQAPACSLTCTASASPGSGQAPLAVSFTATATPSNCSGAVAYAWTFGDGATSALQNPPHTYTAAGTYSWAMTASVSGVNGSKSGSVTVTAPPTCSLACAPAANPAMGQAPLSVNFSANTTATGCSGATTYAWTFGDGATSSSQNPFHTYAAAGTYWWTFSASAGGQSCTGSGSVTATPVGDGTALTSGVPVQGTMTGTSHNSTWDYYYIDIPSGVAGVVVDAYDLSGDLDLYVRGGQKPDLNQYDCRSWEFDTTPEHCAVPLSGPQRAWIGVTNYLVGTIQYTVRATLGGGGSCLLTCAGSAMPSGGRTVQFTGASSVSGCSESPTYIWDFGDGSSSMEQSPTHTYTSAGTYSWALLVVADSEHCEVTGNIAVAGE